MMKVCTACKTSKSFDAFHRDNTKPTGRHPRCKDCANHQSRQRAAARRATPEGKKKLAESSRKYLYGVGPEDYALLLSSQSGVCAICSKPPLNRGLSVDHDHDTGLVRGLLCDNCNMGIGCFKDSLALLIKAVNYLEAN